MEYLGISIDLEKEVSEFLAELDVKVSKLKEMSI